MNKVSYTAPYIEYNTGNYNTPLTPYFPHPYMTNQYNQVYLDKPWFQPAVDWVKSWFYPPTIYWFPTPLTCYDKYPVEICDNYKKRLRDYRGCQFCQQSRMCWDPNEGCYQCNLHQAMQSCAKQPNPLGFPHGNSLPTL